MSNVHIIDHEIYLIDNLSSINKLKIIEHQEIRFNMYYRLSYNFLQISSLMINIKAKM